MISKGKLMLESKTVQISPTSDKIVNSGESSIGVPGVTPSFSGITCDHPPFPKYCKTPVGLALSGENDKKC